MQDNPKQTGNGSQKESTVETTSEKNELPPKAADKTAVIATDTATEPTAQADCATQAPAQEPKEQSTQTADASQPDAECPVSTDTPEADLAVETAETPVSTPAQPAKDKRRKLKLPYATRRKPTAPDAQWHAQHEAVVGLAHRNANPPLPCQDSALASCKIRPLVLVADGAGSSAVSEIGSHAVTIGLNRLLNTLEQQVGKLLDQPGTDADQAHSFGLMLVKHALGILEDLAVEHRRPLRDFRCTLLLAINGKHHCLWLKIGDGALVAEQIQHKDNSLQPKLFSLGQAGKGEFANQTTFIDEHLQPSDVQTGLQPSAQITGLAAMSDGAAERLVANDGSRVADKIAGWLQELRTRKLKRSALTRAFYTDEFVKGTSGDDCSLALVACELSEPSKTSKTAG